MQVDASQAKPASSKKRAFSEISYSEVPGNDHFSSDKIFSEEFEKYKETKKKRKIANTVVCRYCKGEFAVKNLKLIILPYEKPGEKPQSVFYLGCKDCAEKFKKDKRGYEECRLSRICTKRAKKEKKTEEYESTPVLDM